MLKSSSATELPLLFKGLQVTCHLTIINNRIRLEIDISKDILINNTKIRWISMKTQTSAYNNNSLAYSLGSNPYDDQLSWKPEVGRNSDLHLIPLSNLIVLSNAIVFLHSLWWSRSLAASSFLNRPQWPLNWLMMSNSKSSSLHSAVDLWSQVVPSSTLHNSAGSITHLSIRSDRSSGGIRQSHCPSERKCKYGE